MPKILKTDHATIITRFKNGETSGDIAPTYHVSRARILQLLRAHGLSGKDGGRSLKPKKAKIKRTENKAAKVFRDYGVSVEIYEQFNRQVHKAYTVHKLNCKRRDIGWAFTLETWAAAWEASGKWDTRGRGKIEGQPKYVMAQPNKTLPIGPENCSVVTLAEALKGRPQKKAKPNVTDGVIVPQKQSVDCVSRES